jgi:hypothetical protein
MDKARRNDTLFPQSSGIHNKHPSSIRGSYNVIPYFAIVPFFVNLLNAILVFENCNRQIKIKAMVLNIRKALCVIPLIPANSEKNSPKHTFSIYVKQPVFQVLMLTNLALVPFLLASCATVPSSPAPWAASPTAIREVYPDGEYLAQRGRGKTRQAAETAATAEIARFKQQAEAFVNLFDAAESEAAPFKKTLRYQATGETLMRQPTVGDASS